MEVKRKWHIITSNKKRKGALSKVGITLVLALLALVAGLSEVAQAETGVEQKGTFAYLPVVSQAPERLDCNVPGSSYGTLSINGAPTPGRVAENPDINLTVRGWKPSGGYLGLVSYGPSEDRKAPQLDTLFAPRRLPRFTSGWDVYGWDWECMCPIEPARPWDLTLLGLKTTPGEVIYPPDSGYDIGGGHDALILYASPTQLTLKYTREDHVVYGYTIHIEEICVEPDLLALYRQADAAGRWALPAVRGGQPLGRAAGEEILVSVRDTGSFMDPRSHYDWWKAQ